VGILKAGFIAAVLTLGAVAAHAQSPATVHDTQFWLLLLGQIPVGDKYVVHLEAQPRWKNDMQDKDQLLLRAALGRRLGPRVTVWGGYGYIPRWSGDTVFHEQRIWEQVSSTFPKVGKWAPSIRLRQEQRFLEQWGDTSHRFRALGRLVRPIGASPWSVAVWDEWFYTLDETVGGPRQGYDQNRFFVTVLRKMSPSVTLEGGYLWQNVPGTATKAERQGHTLFTWFTYAPPVKKKATP
jgi:hypothetical protein